MANNSGRFRRYIMSFYFKERRSRALAKYMERVCELNNMKSDELDFEYISLKSEYEHKKSVLSIFMISIALAVLMSVWKYFFIFIDKALEYATVFEGSEVEIAKVSFAISIIVVVFITIVILAILIMSMKDIFRIQKELMIVEEVRNKKYVRKNQSKE